MINSPKKTPAQIWPGSVILDCLYALKRMMLIKAEWQLFWCLWLEV